MAEPPGRWGSEMRVALLIERLGLLDPENAQSSMVWAIEAINRVLTAF